jgi:CcmD family protein
MANRHGDRVISTAPRRKVVWGGVQVVVGVLLIILTAGAVLAAGQPPPGQEGFVRADTLPPQQEQLPAAPLVMAAYAVAWVAILLYVWSIWRRLGRVEREIADVTRRVEAGARR